MTREERAKEMNIRRMNAKKEKEKRVQKIKELLYAAKVTEESSYLSIDEMGSGSLLPELTYSLEKTLVKRDLLSHLSAEAREVVELIVLAPEEVITQLETITGFYPQKPLNEKQIFSKRRLRRYFRENRNWSSATINNAFKEIKTCLQRLP